MRVYCCTANGCSAMLLVGKEPAMQSQTYPPYTVIPPTHTCPPSPPTQVSIDLQKCVLFCGDGTPVDFKKEEHSVG